MQPKHIILLGPAYPYRGGLATFDERLALQLRSEGHQVEIYTFTLQYPSLLFPGKTQYCTEPQGNDLTIYRRVNSINPFNWISVGRELARLRPDLLITRFWLPYMGPSLASISRIVRRNGHTRVVALIDNLIPHEKRPGDIPLTRYFTSSMDGFVAMSQSVLDDLNAFDKVKPRRFCRHPIYDHYGEPVEREEACRTLGLDPQYRYLLFFGFIRDYKGLDWLLTAFADARLRDKKLRLLVAGEFYNNEQQYRDLVVQLGINDEIVWRTEFIADSQVRYYFGASDLIVQPYKTATQSGVTQVAYHFEKPMLVTRVGGLPEIVPDGRVGYAVEPTPTAIADALVDFVTVDHSETFAAGIREEKAKYAWSNMSRAVLEVLG
jgi:glycosyltransferase involved in cell wall biosynthesis